MSESDDDGSRTFLHFDGLPVLSRSAFQLHSFAALNSIQAGHPGFVSDDYLNAISAETSVTALELEAAGMWQRRDEGYFIVADEMVAMMVSHNEEMDRLAAACQTRGAHTEGEDAGAWIICADCGIPLVRPDGGPVALPHGGKLGPDAREGGVAS
ncbi:hypothetical protein [Modestobacter sp. VKM Ac-2984]|uniref:hypothetical protein n=1 Tax=Modestobacter sp. VKM Ac-2984 TaxID=3004138 RepID=UPI0022AADC91|nr:hypothetical protein [Modestobacter sp. VKM Ac-2984]MCZ2818028.1 hypothetical protein [Modestobacter sp. VKM Ac-2984]